MSTWVRTMAVTAVTTVAMSLGAVRGGSPPAGDRGRLMCFELADGTVITGRTDLKVIAVRLAGGDVLNVPVADLTELTVGLNDRPAFVRRVEALIRALDSPETCQDAQQKLIDLGRAVAPILRRHLASEIAPRRAAVGLVLKAHRGWYIVYPDAPVAMTLPLRSQSTVRAGEFRLTGTVVVKQFRIASPCGPVTVKLDEVHRAYPAAPALGKLGHWAVRLRDKSRFTSSVMVSPSLRVRTRHGTLVVPFARIWKVTFAPDEKGVRVKCLGVDRVVGTLEPGTTISFKTDTGRADLPVEKIAAMVFGPLTLKGHTRTVRSVAFLSDGKRLVSRSDDGTMRLWDPLSGKELFKIGTGAPCTLSLDGKCYAAVGGIWDSATRKKLASMDWASSHPKRVRSVAFSPDGKRLASGGNCIVLWDTSTGKKRLTFKGHPFYGAYCVVFSPDGKRLASGSSDKTVKLWDTTTGKELLTLRGHLGTVTSVAFSPDGKRLVSARGRSLRLWDTVGGGELLALENHFGKVTSVAFSPDSTLLASGTYSDTIRLWETHTGKELRIFNSGSSCVAFSPDGKYLASGGRRVTLWNTATGKELYRLKGEATSVAFSPDGKYLVLGSRDKTITLWDLPAGIESPAPDRGGQSKSPISGDP